jgi:hypothetical protein
MSIYFALYLESGRATSSGQATLKIPAAESPATSNKVQCGGAAS